MLTDFPSLLTYGFFAPTLLRVAVALVFFYLCYKMYQEREVIGKTRFPIVGVPGAWFAWVSAVLCAIVALAFLFGWHTQIAAIFGALGALKMFFFAKYYRSIIPLSRTASLLLLVICLSLLISGAGAFAMDLPL